MLSSRPRVWQRLQASIETLKLKNERLRSLEQGGLQAAADMQKQRAAQVPEAAPEGRQAARAARLADQERLVLEERAAAAAAEAAAKVPPAPSQHGPARAKTRYTTRTARQEEVIQTMKWAWKGYKEHAWGHDELQPVSRKYNEWFKLGLTLVDALDTLYIMGLDEEFGEARDWVKDSLDLTQNVDVNLFECTIRVLGGMLSSFALSGDAVFLDKAKDLGDRLLPAFGQSGIPFSDVNLGTHKAHKPRWGPDSSTSEVSTIQMEFKYLSKLTGNRVYRDKVDAVMMHLKDLPKTDGLVPIFVNAVTGRFSGNTITLGARGDSYYEYLLKQWLLTDKKEDVYREMYLEAVAGIQKRLIKKTKGGLTYIAELINGASKAKMVRFRLVVARRLSRRPSFVVYRPGPPLTTPRVTGPPRLLHAGHPCARLRARPRPLAPRAGGRAHAHVCGDVQADAVRPGTGNRPLPPRRMANHTISRPPRPPGPPPPLAPQRVPATLPSPLTRAACARRRRTTRPTTCS